MSDHIRQQVEQAFQRHRDHRAFQQEVMGEFLPPSAEYLDAYHRWERYHAECAAFDRFYENVEGFLPDYARPIVNRNAIEAHRRASDDLLRHGIDPEVIRQARLDVNRDIGKREAAANREKEERDRRGR